MDPRVMNHLANNNGDSDDGEDRPLQIVENNGGGQNVGSVHDVDEDMDEQQEQQPAAYPAQYRPPSSNSSSSHNNHNLQDNSTSFLPALNTDEAQHGVMSSPNTPAHTPSLLRQATPSPSVSRQATPSPSPSRQRPKTTTSMSLSVGWNEHNSSMMTLLYDQALRNEHCDVTVIVQEEKFAAHAAVLSAASGHLQASIKSLKSSLNNRSTTERSHQVILEGMSPDDFERLRELMYLGHVDVPTEAMNRLKQAAESLNINFGLNNSNTMSLSMATDPNPAATLRRRTVATTHAGFHLGSREMFPFTQAGGEETVQQRTVNVTTNNGQNFLNASPAHNLPIQHNSWAQPQNPTNNVRVGRVSVATGLTNAWNNAGPKRTTNNANGLLGLANKNNRSPQQQQFNNKQQRNGATQKVTGASRRKSSLLKSAALSPPMPQAAAPAPAPTGATTSKKFDLDSLLKMRMNNSMQVAVQGASADAINRYRHPSNASTSPHGSGGTNTPDSIKSIATMSGPAVPAASSAQREATAVAALNAMKQKSEAINNQAHGLTEEQMRSYQIMAANANLATPEERVNLVMRMQNALATNAKKEEEPEDSLTAYYERKLNMNFRASLEKKFASENNADLTAPAALGSANQMFQNAPAPRRHSLPAVDNSQIMQGLQAASEAALQLHSNQQAPSINGGNALLMRGLQNVAEGNASPGSPQMAAMAAHYEQLQQQMQQQQQQQQPTYAEQLQQQREQQQPANSIQMQHMQMALASALQAQQQAQQPQPSGPRPSTSRGRGGRGRGRGRTTRSNMAKDENGDPIIGANGRPMVQCDQCGKKLADPSSLYRHRKIHTGEKPHQCPCCTRMFIQRYNMKQHVRTHRHELTKAQIDNLDADLSAAIYTVMAQTGQVPVSEEAAQAAVAARAAQPEPEEEEEEIVEDEEEENEEEGGGGYYPEEGDDEPIIDQEGAQPM